MTPRVIKHARRVVALERVLMEIQAHEDQLVELARSVRRPVLRGMLTCVCTNLHEALCATVDDLVESREIVAEWTTDARDRMRELLAKVDRSIAEPIGQRLDAGGVLSARVRRTLLALDRKAGPVLETWNQLARIYSRVNGANGADVEPAVDEPLGQTGNALRGAA